MFRGQEGMILMRPAHGPVIRSFYRLFPSVPSTNRSEIDPVFSYAVREDPLCRSQPSCRFCLVAAGLLQGGNDDVFLKVGDRTLEKIVIG
jgi:hypothetical protein